MSNLETLPAALNTALIFAALGDQTRLSLLTQLSGGERQSIARLSSRTDLTRQAVTKHLKVLEDVGLVVCHRIGRESQYVFRPQPMIEARNYLDGVSQLWGDALGRLQALVEG